MKASERHWRLKSRKLDIFVKTSSWGLIFGAMLQKTVRMKLGIFYLFKKKEGSITSELEVGERIVEICLLDKTIQRFGHLP